MPHLNTAAVQQALRSTWQQAQAGKTSFLFLRHQAPADRIISRDFWKNVLPGKGHQEFHLFPSGAISSPLSPLLGYLRQKLINYPASQWPGILESAQVYSFHRNMILSWLQTGTPIRRDEVLFYPAEQRFEQDQISLALGRLLAWIHREEPGMFIWEDFQNAGAPLMRCLEKMILNPPEGKLAIICIIRQSGQLFANWKKESWHGFFSLVEAKGLFLRLREGVATEPRPIREKNPVPKQARHGAQVARCFLAHEDGLALLSGVPKKAGKEGAEGDFLLGELYYLQESYINAILYLNLALEEARLQGLADLEARIFDRLSLCHFRKKDLIQAGKYWKQAEMAAQRGKDPELQSQLVLSQIMLQEELLTFESFWPKLDKLEKDLRTLGLENSLSFLESLVPYYRGMVERRSWDDAVNAARGALERVQAQGNAYRESVLFHTLGYLHEYHGLKTEALRFFQRGIVLRQRLGDPVELIKVYNGTGYFCFTTGDFSNALKFFEKSLGLLEPLKDFTETCLTLYNMAMVHFFSGRFAVALNYLENILEVMDNLQLTALPWHSRAKLYTLAGIAAFHLGYMTRCLDFWESAEAETLDPPALPSYHLLKAILGQELEKPEWALEHTSEAARQAELQNLGYFQIQCYLERGVLARNLGQSAEAEAAFKAAGDLLKIHAIEAQKYILAYLAAGTPWAEIPLETSTESKVDMLIRGLTASARQEASSHDLFQKIHEINFLKNFQGILAGDLSPRVLLDTSLDLLRQNFLVSEWRLEDGDQRGASEGLRFFLKNARDTGVTLVLITAGDDLSENEIKVITLALNQLDMVLELQNTKESLKRAATYDALTGVLSRPEFLRRLDAEHRRALRYKTHPSKTFALLFVDLDNFKYYNDTFGHSAGDLILQNFAKILQAQVRDVDFIGRYGGDEFLVVLPETPFEGAQVVAQRILTETQAAGGFKTHLEQHLGHPVTLDPQKFVGCSIGAVCFDSSVHKNLEELLEKADQALYKSKKNGKGITTFFQG